MNIQWIEPTMIKPLSSMLHSDFAEPALWNKAQDRKHNNTFMHHIVNLRIEQIWKVKALMTHCEEM